MEKMKKWEREMVLAKLNKLNDELDFWMKKGREEKVAEVEKQWKSLERLLALDEML